MTDNVDALIAVIRRDLTDQGWKKTDIDCYLVGYLGQFLKQAASASSAIRNDVEWSIRNRSKNIRGTLDAGGVMGQPG